MHTNLLTPILILLGAGSLAALLTARLGVPTLLGYLTAGVILGPGALAWIMPGPALSFLSELGVALLLFMVGLEFSLGHFWLTRKTVLRAGSLQMLLVGVPVSLTLVWLGLPAATAALLGAAAAMSSTALVARQLAEQGELTTRHGRSAIAVLVFQDLASVPLLALLAIWARGETPDVLAIVAEVLGVLLLFAVAALLARRVLHGLLAWVVQHGSDEAFVLVSLAVVIAAASAAHAVGVSAALAAFLAGMVLGESDFRHHMEHHLRPFRDVLSGLFFITLGLQLDPTRIVVAPLLVLGGLVLLVPVKIGLNYLALRLARLSALDAWRTAIVLGHGGEFALLLLGLALQQQMIPAEVAQPALVALVLSMAAAPLLIRRHEGWAAYLAATGGRAQPPQAEEDVIASQSGHLRGHVIVCGAGKLGLAVSLALQARGIAHLLIDSDDQQVAVAQAAGAPICHGDASRIDTLTAAGLARARLLVVTFLQLVPAQRTVRAALTLSPHLSIIVACASERATQAFQGLPNVRVILEPMAAGLALADAAMEILGESGVRLHSSS
jgi:CPA2 family monovalent cation:H+ antiporter-2